MSDGWDREWSFLQERCKAPHEPKLGCSTVSHDHMGFCGGCAPVLRDGGPNGIEAEVMAWRLLALREDNDDERVTCIECGRVGTHRVCQDCFERTLA